MYVCRFDHLRWVSFNATHAFYPDDQHEVALISGAHRQALDVSTTLVYCCTTGHKPFYDEQ